MMKTFQMIEIIPIITCTLNVIKHIEKSTLYKAPNQDIELFFFIYSNPLVLKPQIKEIQSYFVHIFFKVHY